MTEEAAFPHDHARGSFYDAVEWAVSPAVQQLGFDDATSEKRRIREKIRRAAQSVSGSEGDPGHMLEELVQDALERLARSHRAYSEVDWASVFAAFAAEEWPRLGDTTEVRAAADAAVFRWRHECGLPAAAAADEMAPLRRGASSGCEASTSPPATRLLAGSVLAAVAEPARVSASRNKGPWTVTGAAGGASAGVLSPAPTEGVPSSVARAATGGCKEMRPTLSANPSTAEVWLRAASAVPETMQAPESERAKERWPGVMAGLRQNIGSPSTGPLPQPAGSLSEIVNEDGSKLEMDLFAKFGLVPPKPLGHRHDEEKKAKASASVDVADTFAKLGLKRPASPEPPASFTSNCDDTSGVGPLVRLGLASRPRSKSPNCRTDPVGMGEKPAVDHLARLGFVPAPPSLPMADPEADRERRSEDPLARLGLIPSSPPRQEPVENGWENWRPRRPAPPPPSAARHDGESDGKRFLESLFSRSPPPPPPRPLSDVPSGSWGLPPPPPKWSDPECEIELLLEHFPANASLGLHVGDGLVVRRVEPGYLADGLVSPGDTVLAVNGRLLGGDRAALSPALEQAKGGALRLAIRPSGDSDDIRARPKSPGRPAIILNCEDIGRHSSDSQGGRSWGDSHFDWALVERAVRHYEELGYEPHAVVRRTTTLHAAQAPEAVAQRLVLCPVMDAAALSEDRLFVVRFAQTHSCHFVDNSNYRDAEQLLGRELHAWFANRSGELKVEYVFDAFGRFLPLRKVSNVA